MTDAVSALAAPTAHMSDVTVGPPPGYAHSLKDLQREAQEQFGMTPSETLAAAQGLYKRNLITDPSTEERRLAQFMFEDAASIINSYKFVSGSGAYDPEYEAPCWTRDIEGIHMGIMPRGMPAAALFGFSMSEAETRIYGLVHARFLSLFVRPAA
jgi:DNA topoisomerase IA